MFDYDAYMLTEVRLFLRKKLFLASWFLNVFKERGQNNRLIFAITTTALLPFSFWPICHVIT